MPVMKEHLPAWLWQWLDVIVPVVQVALILLAAWLLRSLARRVIQRIAAHYALPQELAMGARRVFGFVIYAAALLLVLERIGVSGTVLWTAFTGFATVAAVAFFAAWSVLSNIFCTMLIFITRPFRLHDQIELLDRGAEPGMKGRVIDINLIYTTLQEHADGNGSDDEGHGSAATTLQIPNSLFFQRTVRRWRYSPRAVTEVDEPTL
ncbi:mechanosensitive ion channel domain-containing protein [Lysobacter cavernae]|uniref:Small-conductance mechanosensitive channel n=1 Tax=Lysobacter cavernae TaxID=1685901 RepID=A0ABV7RUQ3_9GAMM